MSEDPEELAPDSQIKASDSLAYWNNISPDVNGMLGGYPHISRIDLQGSRNFITKISRLLHASVVEDSDHGARNEQPPASKRLKLAVDCGAGIGRVTEGCLSHLCEIVDAVEPITKFANVLTNSALKKEGRVGEVYVTPLEVWDPPLEKRYDLVWNQWCLGHLTDTQLVAYLRRASEALVDHGWIGVKENISRDGAADIFDDLDSSVTRSDAKFRAIFVEAGLRIMKTELQTGFPKGMGLYPVRMYALVRK